MTSRNQSYLLRTEAQPVQRWDDFSIDQKKALQKILEHLREAIERRTFSKRSSVDVPSWLEEEFWSQLLFLDGRRGTGKTTVFLSLTTLLSDEYSLPDDFPKALRGLVRDLQRRVIVLEPFDMEPLPPNTNILAGILARAERRVNELKKRDSTHRNLLDYSHEDSRENVRFRQIHARASRALDSNLSERKGSLDRIQLGQSIIEQERDRLQLRSDLDTMLEEYLKQVPLFPSSTSGNRPRGDRGDSDSIQRLFLVPIDDVDLNPEHCHELLRLMRSCASRFLYFLPMGQFDLVKSIVRMKTAMEFSRVAPNKKHLEVSGLNELARDATAVAIANLKKLIPNQVNLSELTQQEVLKFRPLGVADDALSLGELLNDVPFVNKLTLGTALRDNLAKHKSNEVGAWPALHAFELPLRRLVDLWRELNEIQVEFPKGDERNKQYLSVFEDLCRWIVEQDPEMSEGVRQQILRSGLRSVHVVPFRHATGIQEEMRIEERLVDVDPVFAADPDAEPNQPRRQVFRPYLQVAEEWESCDIPLFEVKNYAANEGGGTTLLTAIRTRSAMVLWHDMSVALDTSFKSPFEPRLSLDVIGIKWSSNIDPIVWEPPPCRTFLDSCVFISNIFPSLPDRGGRRRERMPINSDELTNLAMKWASLGMEAVCPNWKETWERSFTKNLSHPEYIEFLNSKIWNCGNVREWLSRVAMLSMPEALATDEIDLVRYIFHDFVYGGMELVSFDEQLQLRSRELIKRRTEQLRPIAEAEEIGLWHVLNERVKDSWLGYVRAVEDWKEDEESINRQLRLIRQEMREELSSISADVQSSSQNLRRSIRNETLLNQIRSLCTEVRAFRLVNRPFALELLQQTRDYLEGVEIRSSDHDDRYRIFQSFADVGQLHIDCYLPEEAISLLDKPIDYFRRRRRRGTEVVFAQILNLQSRALFLMGNYGASNAFCQEIVDYLTRTGDGKDWDAKVIESKARLRKGMLAFELFELDIAAARFRESIEVLQPDQEVRSEALEVIVKGKLYLARVAMGQGHLVEAENLIWEVDNLVGKLVSPRSLRELLEDVRSQLFMEKGELKNSIAVLSSHLPDWRTPEREAELVYSPRFRMELRLSQLVRSGGKQNLDGTEERLNSVLHDAELATVLGKEVVYSWISLIDVLNERGELELHESRVSKAAEYFADAAARSRAWVAAKTEVVQFSVSLVRNLCGLAESQFSEQRLESALESVTGAQAVVEELLRKQPEARQFRLLSARTNWLLARIKTMKSSERKSLDLRARVVLEELRANSTWLAPEYQRILESAPIEE